MARNGAEGRGELFLQHMHLLTRFFELLGDRRAVLSCARRRRRLQRLASRTPFDLQGFRALCRRLELLLGLVDRTLAILASRCQLFGFPGGGLQLGFQTRNALIAHADVFGGRGAGGVTRQLCGEAFNFGTCRCQALL